MSVPKSPSLSCSGRTASRGLEKSDLDSRFFLLRGRLNVLCLRPVIAGDKCFCGESQPQLEADGEGCYLRHAAQLRCSVLELFEGFFLRFGQRLCQLFFVPGDELQDMCVFSGPTEAAVLRKLRSAGVILP